MLYIRETIAIPRKEIMSSVLNEQNPSARSIVDLLYGILLARVYENTASEDAYDISKLLTYSLNRCVDPTREVEHHHPIRNAVVHNRITNEIRDHTFKFTFNRMADILVWVMRPEQITTTAMEFYTTIPGLFLHDVEGSGWIEPLIKNDKYTSELIHRVCLRADLVPVYPPRVDMEMDKMRWIHECTKVAKHLDRQLRKMKTETWVVYAKQCMSLTCLQLILTTIQRSSGIELLSECAKPIYTTLRVQASEIVYSRTRKVKG